MESNARSLFTLPQFIIVFFLIVTVTPITAFARSGNQAFGCYDTVDGSVRYIFIANIVDTPSGGRYLNTITRSDNQSIVPGGATLAKWNAGSPSVVGWQWYPKSNVWNASWDATLNLYYWDARRGRYCYSMTAKITGGIGENAWIAAVHPWPL